MAVSLIVHWKDVPENGDAADTDDIIPFEWFLNEATTVGVTHLVQESVHSNGSWRGFARCDLKVRGNIAELFYDKHNAFNEKHSMECGRMSVTFTNLNRRKIKKIEWADNPGDEYYVPEVEFWVAEPPACDDAPPPSRVKVTSSRVVRDTAVSQGVK